MITIAWDVDDVLNDLMCSWFKQTWRTKHPECDLAYEDITENPPHALLRANKSEYLASLDQFRLSESFQEMEPVAEVKAWFVEHGDKFRHIALTAVPLHAAAASAQWVLNNFGLWIRTFHFVPSRREGQDVIEYDTSKAAYLKRLGYVSVLVDDSEQNVNEAVEVGVRGILMPRPWNSSTASTEETLEIVAKAAAGPSILSV